MATPNAGWEERREIATDIGQNMFGFVRKHQFSKTQTCCGSTFLKIYFALMCSVYWLKFLSMIFFSVDFCSVFFNEKHWEREKMWRLHALMIRNSVPGRKPCTAHRGSLSPGELLWPSPGVLTSISFYLGRWQNSEKILYVLLWFFLSKYEHRVNKEIKQAD